MYIMKREILVSRGRREIIYIYIYREREGERFRTLVGPRGPRDTRDPSHVSYLENNIEPSIPDAECHKI